MPTRINSYSQTLMFASNFKYKLFTKGSFLQNIAVVFTGSAMGAVIQILFTPILSRIYGPEVYGLVAVYTMLLTNLMLFSTLSYDEALILTKNEDDFIALMKWLLLQLLGFMAVLILLWLIAGDWLYKRFFNVEMPVWILLVIPGIIISILGNIFHIWNIRDKSFKRNAFANIANGLTAKLTSIGYAYILTPTIYGQLSGSILGSFSDLILKSRKTYWLEIKKCFLEIFSFSVKDAWSQAKYFKRYPSYIFASTWMNRFSTQIPLIAFGSYYGIEQIGYYTFAMAMLNLPVNLIGNSIKPVFFQKAIELYRSDRIAFRNFSRSSFRHLFYIGIVPLEILTNFGEQVFSFVFGNQWIAAGLVATSMGLSVFFQLLSSPLASIRRICGKEKSILFINLLLFALSSSLFMFLQLYKPSFEIAVTYYGRAIGLFYLFNCINILHIAGVNWKTELLKVILTITIVKTLIYLPNVTVDYEYISEKIYLGFSAVCCPFI